MIQGQTVAVAGSTLLAAALFQPLRRRVQVAVDHRFNRARYDAERTATDFAERLRDEIDLASVSGDIVGVVDTALRPTTVGVWIRRAGTDHTVTIPGRPTASMRLEMTALTRPIRRLLGRGAPAVDGRAGRPSRGTDRRAGARPSTQRPARSAVDIAESDPLLAYLQSAPGPVDLARLELESPAVTRAARRPAWR